MPRLLKGNYKLPTDKNKEMDLKRLYEETATTEFERRSLDVLGGSICFVKKDKWVWKGENSGG